MQSLSVVYHLCQNKATVNWPYEAFHLLVDCWKTSCYGEPKHICQAVVDHQTLSWDGSSWITIRLIYQTPRRTSSSKPYSKLGNMGLLKIPSTGQDDENRQALIWNPNVSDVNDQMLRYKCKVNWGNLACGPIETMQWKIFLQKSKVEQSKVLNMYLPWL